MMRYTRYATLTIPAGTTVLRAHDYFPTELIVPLTCRATLAVTAKDIPKSGALWVFGLGAYNYTTSVDTPGLTVAETRVVSLPL